MKLTIGPSILLIFSLSAAADIQNDGMEFLNGFPGAIECSGVEKSLTTGRETKLEQKVTIKISGTELRNPLIEISAPSSSMISGQRFSLGNFKSDRVKWLFFSDQKTIYSFRVFDATQDVDQQDFLRIRDAGGLSSFSQDKVCTTGFRCVLLSDCIAM